jgi:hypothetical protein
MGNTAIGAAVDIGNSNAMNGSRVSTGGLPIAARSISVYVADLDASTSNRSFQVAIYSDASGRPDALITSSGSGTLVANAWSTLPISATLAPNTSYWLMFNTNGRSASVNNMRFDPSTAGSGAYSAGPVPFGSWPPTFGSAVMSSQRWSIYLRF